MRQLFTIRFVATLGALLLLALLVNAVFVDGSRIDAALADSTPTERRVDLIAPVETIVRSDDFALDEDGVAVGYMDLVLGPERVMRIAPGTPGEITCANTLTPNRCVVFADMLGDAVIWFAVTPRGPNDTVVLGPIVDLQDGYAVFATGWEVSYPPVIERICDADIPNFSDFLRRFGPDSTSIVDLETQEVVAVECGDEVPPTTVAPSGSLTGSIVTR